MNVPIEISSLADYIDRINDITDPEVNYIYRGQRNAEWQVSSSAYHRLLKVQPDTEPELLANLFVGYLKQIVDEIQLKYPSTYKDFSPLECMAHLQHNKVATGLIDFTFNPLVALWFACENQDNRDGKVLVLENDREKIDEITTKDKLQQELDVFFDMDQPQWHLWAPTLDSLAVDTQRMTMQQSVFLFGLPKVDAEMVMQEIIVPHEHKERLRTELAKIGITEKTLFSDLIGFFERNTHAHLYDLSLAEPYYGENQR